MKRRLVDPFCNDWHVSANKAPSKRLLWTLPSKKREPVARTLSLRQSPCKTPSLALLRILLGTKALSLKKLQEPSKKPAASL